MQSGIKIHATVSGAFEAMKIRKPRSDYTRKKFLRLRISDDEKFMIVDDEFDTVQQTSEDSFQQLLKLLTPTSCRFIIYDVSYGTKDSPIKEDLVLIQWCPEKAETKEKVQYSMTKNTLKGTLKGFKAELEINSLDEIDRSALAEKLGNDVLQVEGVNV